MVTMQFFNLLKATIPTELYHTLYGHDNFYIVMTMLKDIYAKKPQPAAAAVVVVAQGGAAPFTLIHSPTRDNAKAPNEGTLEEKIVSNSLRLCITLTWMASLSESLLSTL